MKNTYNKEASAKSGLLLNLHRFDQVKDRICIKLVNQKKYDHLLGQMPHIIIKDLAAVFYLYLSGTDDSLQSMIVQNEHLSLWGHTDLSVLYTLALENTKRILGTKIDTLDNMLCEMSDDIPQAQGKESAKNEDGDFIYVATNQIGIHGAVAMFYPGLLESFAKKVNSDFYILPSSIHETIFIPAGENSDSRGLLNILRWLNDVGVEEADFLSDNIYRYHRSTNTVEMIS